VASGPVDTTLAGEFTRPATAGGTGAEAGAAFGRGGDPAAADAVRLGARPGAAGSLPLGSGGFALRSRAPHRVLTRCRQVPVPAATPGAGFPARRTG
jgi:hypothetical protein